MRKDVLVLNGWKDGVILDGKGNVWEVGDTSGRGNQVFHWACKLETVGDTCVGRNASTQRRSRGLRHKHGSHLFQVII